MLFSALLWGFRDFLGEPGWKQLGMGLGELQELVRGKVAGGWPAILTRNSAAGVAAPFGLQVCHALKFSYKHYRGIASSMFFFVRLACSDNFEGHPLKPVKTCYIHVMPTLLVGRERERERERKGHKELVPFRFLTQRSRGASAVNSDAARSSSQSCPLQRSGLTVTIRCCSIS